MIATPTPKPTVTIRLGTFTQRRRADITSVTAPPHPLGSRDLLILRAWVESELAHPGDAHAAATAVATAIERALGRANTSGQVSDVYERLPVWMRPLFGLPQGEGLKRLLGRWGKNGGFQPADVAEAWQLTELEAKVYWWYIRGWDFRSIQRELTPKAMRFDARHWVGAEHVHELLEGSGRKVRLMFGLADA